MQFYGNSFIYKWMTSHNFRQFGWLVKLKTNSNSFISLAMFIPNRSRFDKAATISHEFGVFCLSEMECVTLKDVHFKEEALIDEKCKKSLYKVQFMSSQQLCADLLIRCCWCWCWCWWWWWCNLNLNTLLKFVFQRKCLRFIFTSCAQHIRFSYRWNLIFNNKTEMKKT